MTVKARSKWNRRSNVSTHSKTTQQICKSVMVATAECEGAGMQLTVIPFKHTF